MTFSLHSTARSRAIWYHSTVRMWASLAGLSLSHSAAFQSYVLSFFWVNCYLTREILQT